jgi:tetratricopeptide (TPR) repeat protein
MTPIRCSLLVAGCWLLVSCDQGGGEIRAAGPPEPSHATIEEAKQIDEAQGLVDDGMFDQARAKLDALFAKGCRHPQAMIIEAKLAYRQGDFEQAIPWCDRALEASPLWVEPRVLMAQSYLKLKRYAAAASSFEDIDRIAPDSPWGPYGMGVIAAMRGDAGTASKELDRALARDGKHAPSLEARAGVARMQQDRALEEKLLQRYVVEEPLDAFAIERLGELARASDRLEDARRAFERSYELARLPDSAKQLAELARQRGDEADERLWSGRAGMRQKPSGDAAPPPH